MKIRVLNENGRGQPDWRQIFLIHYFTYHPELKHAPVNWDEERHSVCELTIQIDGVEVDPMDFLNRMKEGLDGSVKEAAVALINDKLTSDLSDAVDQIQDACTAVKEQIYKTFGVEMPEEW